MFAQQRTLEGVTAGVGSRVSSITWEEELLLRGVRPDSEYVPLLHPVFPSPRSKDDGVTSVSPEVMRGVFAGEDVSACGLKGERLAGNPGDKPRTRSPPKVISARIPRKELANSPSGESVIGYSSDGGLSSITQGRVMPPSLVPARVIVPSLIPMRDEAPPPTRERTKPPHTRLKGLPGGFLPPLNTDTFRDVEMAKVSSSKEPASSQKLNPMGGSAPFSSGAIPISDTQATLTRLGDFTLPSSWPLQDDNRKHLVRRCSTGRKTALAPVRSSGKSPVGVVDKKKVLLHENSRKKRESEGHDVK
ncbi:hypothetical protein MOQ_002553 [Trypanosoma cruzi marinkellei]|uniref:Uncharacterized protein n=1 Tax=Trypanosoma cruzi marinkellei TaxID=85056 RepID=K2NFA0_TRYCR|nr:hypothetical protein MOQ_002553 [Trypanosoma cruzi marinkellei]